MCEFYSQNYAINTFALSFFRVLFDLLYTSLQIKYENMIILSALQSLICFFYDLTILILILKVKFIKRVLQ